MKKHAYLLIVHNEFHMLKKLLGQLDDSRNDIFIHIDKKTKYVDLSTISSWVHHSKVTFIPRKKIYWGTMSIVNCEIELLKAAIRGNYSYYHLISGVDFPLKSQDFIHDYLENENSEFFSVHEDGEYNDDFGYKIKYYFPLLKIVGRGYFSGKGKKATLMRRIGNCQIALMNFQKKHGVDRTKKYPDITFYKGAQWFTITHDFAKYIIDNSKTISKMYWLTNAPDEIAISTLVMNSDFKNRVKRMNLREIDWDRGNAYSYTIDDLERLEKSEAFFARKISYNDNPLLVNELNRFINCSEQKENYPLISVIVPCYNVAEFLGECVDSLLAQTYKNLEIILVDDGATDNTGEIAKRYAQNNTNVQYVYRENGGLSAARNTGIDNSKGEYVAFIDSDDYVEPNYIERLYSAIKDTGAEVSVCGYRKEGMEHDAVAFDDDEVISPHTAMKILGDIYPKENVLLVIAANKLFKRTLFSNIRFAEGKIHEDEHIAHRLLGEADSIALIKDCLYHYRIREGSITAGRASQNLKHLDIMDAYRDRLEYSCGMMHGDLVIYMLYAYFEGLKQLMTIYTDETFEKNKLGRFFSKKALEVYIKYFGELRGYEKKDYLKLILFPSKYRKNVIRLRKERETLGK